MSTVTDQLGIDTSPATFEEYLANWQKTAAAIKELSTLEHAMRKAMVDVAFPTPKEGVNDRVLADGRKLKATVKITRGINEAMIPLARSEYALLNDAPVEFDTLLKVKYELSVSAFRKLAGHSGALAAVSRMVTSKPAMPSVEVV